MKNENVHKKLVCFCEATLSFSLCMFSMVIDWDPCQYQIVSLSFILSLHQHLTPSLSGSLCVCAMQCNPICGIYSTKFAPMWVLSTEFEFLKRIKPIQRPKHSRCIADISNGLHDASALYSFSMRTRKEKGEKCTAVAVEACHSSSHNYTTW